MPPRNCTIIKEEVIAVSKRITLPIDLEEYKAIVQETRAFRSWVVWLNAAILAIKRLFRAVFLSTYPNVRASEEERRIQG